MQHEKAAWLPREPEWLHPPGLDILPGQTGKREEKTDNPSKKDE